MQPISAKVRVSPHVIPADELDSRLISIRAEIDAAGSVSTDRLSTALSARARRLHQLWWTVAPPALIPSPTPRGRAATFVKRVVRRLTGWYVEPRWIGQREIDAEVARFAEAAALELAELRAAVSELQLRNAELDKRLRRLQQTTSSRRS